MKRYNVVYADPPWKIKAGRKIGGYKMENGKQLFLSDDNKTRNTEYPHMTIQEIKNLDIKNITAEDAHLYMWVTNAHLPFAFDILEAWGFKYSTTLVWAKNRMGGGLGGTFKISTEFLIYARKGKLKPNEKIGNTWFNVKRTYVNGAPKHSKKPDFFYEMIEKVSPGHKIELFARSKRDGWDCWGNELENDIIINSQS